MTDPRINPDEPEADESTERESIAERENPLRSGTLRLTEPDPDIPPLERLRRAYSGYYE